LLYAARRQARRGQAAVGALSALPPGPRGGYDVSTWRRRPRQRGGGRHARGPGRQLPGCCRSSARTPEGVPGSVDTAPALLAKWGYEPHTVPGREPLRASPAAVIGTDEWPARGKGAWQDGQWSAGGAPSGPRGAGGIGKPGKAPPTPSAGGPAH